MKFILLILVILSVKSDHAQDCAYDIKNIIVDFTKAIQAFPNVQKQFEFFTRGLLAVGASV